MRVPRWQPLAWDSENFGGPVARIEPTVPPEALPDVLEELSKAGIWLAYDILREPSGARGAASLNAGGRLVDRKTTFVGGLSQILAATGTHDVPLRAFEGPASAPLVELARAAGEHSRFSRDPRFPRAAFERLYALWIERSVRREIAAEVFVCEDAEGLTGMVTVGKKDGRADIGLIAVAPRARGRGLGRALVAAAAQWAQDQGLIEAQVVTQGENEPACRLYRECGYAVDTVDAVFHHYPRARS